MTTPKPKTAQQEKILKRFNGMTRVFDSVGDKIEFIVETAEATDLYEYGLINSQQELRIFLIAQAIEEAEKRGAEAKTEGIKPYVEAVLTDSRTLQAEASVLAVALEEAPHGKDCHFVNQRLPGLVEKLQEEGLFPKGLCKCWKSKLPDTNPATKAAMAVIEAAVKVSDNGIHLEDANDRVIEDTMALYGAVDNYKRVMGGSDDA